jgi:adenylosuccinate lyase
MSLTAISPIDGRYHGKTYTLQSYFSEFALIKYRVNIEISYFIELVQLELSPFQDFPKNLLPKIADLHQNFSLDDAQKIKKIEQITNHDVKAVEYWIKEKFDVLGLSGYKEFIHFGLTSQDINNTAVPLSIKDALHCEVIPKIQSIIDAIEEKAKLWKSVTMLAKTHGQPASPTFLGKEFQVFAERIKNQLQILQTTPHAGKFGGATGNMNAHYLTFPQIDWHQFATQFLKNKLGLFRSYPTTQIEHYDYLAAQLDAVKRINTIMIDFCRDIWTYISMDYFKQKVKAGEVGSSAMPHKVNPIDFENAEGNLGLANALLSHLAQKLPISRLQRDLTDSTVLRNIGVPFAHDLIAFSSIMKGLDKLILNQEAIDQDLNDNWAVIAEGIQNILRREGFEKPYELLKDLTRGKKQLNQDDFARWIKELQVQPQVKETLLKISPFNYTGKF